MLNGKLLESLSNFKNLTFVRFIFTSFITLSLSGCSYNSNDEQVKASWAEAINQYQRRAEYDDQ